MRSSRKVGEVEKACARRTTESVRGVERESGRSYRGARAGIAAKSLWSLRRARAKEEWLSPPRKGLVLCTKTWAPCRGCPTRVVGVAALRAALHSLANGMAQVALDGEGGTAGTSQEESEGVSEGVKLVEVHVTGGQAVEERHGLEMRLYGLLYSRTLRRDKKGRDEVLEVREGEDPASERRYAAEVRRLLQAEER